jgi:TolB-like protein
MALALAALLALGLGVLMLHRGPRQGPGTTRRSVAVLGFRNVSGQPEAAWLSTALSELLRAELGAGEKLRIIPGENVARMRAELGLPEADSLARDALTRIRSSLGSDLVLLGSYTTAGPPQGGETLHLELLLLDTSEGQTVAAVTDEGDGRRPA